MAKSAVAPVREFRAEAKFQRTSPQKAKLVLDMIKGLRVEQAINTIHFSTKRMAPVIEKVLQSAIANASYLFRTSRVWMSTWITSTFAPRLPTKVRA